MSDKRTENGERQRSEGPRQVEGLFAYMNGMMQGPAVESRPDGKRVEFTYVDGERVTVSPPARAEMNLVNRRGQ